MSPSEIAVGGTLPPDGTLRLDHKPDLTPGRVTVVLRPDPAPAPRPQEDWLQHLLRIRAEREVSGYPFMNEGQAGAYIDWLREEDRIDDLLNNPPRAFGGGERTGG